MNRLELLELLKQLAERSHDFRADIEVIHSEADDALLKFINDDEITEAFDNIQKWYA